MKSLTLARPHLLVLVGIPGSGKSFFAEKFAETFTTPRVSIHDVMGLGIESDIAYMLVLQQLKELVKTKQTVIVDINPIQRAARLDLTKIARSSGYEIVFIWTQVDPLTAKKRFAKQYSMQASDALSAFDDRHRRFQPPHITERPLVISGKHTFATQVKVVLMKLVAPRVAIVADTQPSVVKRSNTNISIH